MTTCEDLIGAGKDSSGRSSAVQRRRRFSNNPASRALRIDLRISFRVYRLPFPFSLSRIVAGTPFRIIIPVLSVDSLIEEGTESHWKVRPEFSIRRILVISIFSSKFEGHRARELYLTPTMDKAGDVCC